MLKRLRVTNFMEPEVVYQGEWIDANDKEAEDQQINEARIAMKKYDQNCNGDWCPNSHWQFVVPADIKF